jgi:hypothetical protein
LQSYNGYRYVTSSVNLQVIYQLYLIIYSPTFFRQKIKSRFGTKMLEMCLGGIELNPYGGNNECALSHDSIN